MADRLGKKRIILPGSLILAFGMAVLAISPELGFLIVAGILVGFGYGSANTALLAFTVERVGEAGKGALLGVYMASINLGMMVGSLTMGPIKDIYGFRVIYLISAFVPAVSAILFALFVKEIYPKGEALSAGGGR